MRKNIEDILTRYVSLQACIFVFAHVARFVPIVVFVPTFVKWLIAVSKYVHIIFTLRAKLCNVL